MKAGQSKVVRVRTFRARDDPLEVGFDAKQTLGMCFNALDQRRRPDDIAPRLGLPDLPKAKYPVRPSAQHPEPFRLHLGEAKVGLVGVGRGRGRG